MSRKNSIVCLLLVLFVAETALAWPRIIDRRRRSSSSSSSGASSYGQVYDDQYLNLPTSSAVYDWEAIAEIEAADFIPIVLDEPISGKLEVKLTSLNNSVETHTIQAELKDGRADVRHESIKSGTMYRLGAVIDGKERIAGPYFTATSGASPEARGRRRIILRYFEQYWRKENGRSYYDANCEAGYGWAIRPFAALPRAGRRRGAPRAAARSRPPAG